MHPSGYGIESAALPHLWFASVEEVVVLAVRGTTASLRAIPAGPDRPAATRRFLSPPSLNGNSRGGIIINHEDNRENERQRVLGPVFESA
jgi:hypothetical protein